MTGETIKTLSFLITYIALLIVDLTTKYKHCASQVGLIVSIHRLVWVFSYLGWIFNSKFVLWGYLVFNIILAIHWATNGWNCTLTEQENKLCNFKPNTRFDYFYMFLGDKKASVVAGILRLVFIAITITKLIKS